MTTFELDLQKFAAKAKSRADSVVHGIVAEITAKIDERSPVGDAKYWKRPPPPGYIGGHFRGNWQLGVDSYPGGTLSRIDPTGTATVAAIIGAIPAQAAGHVFTIANNLPYAVRLEEGWSHQQPEGIVGRTAVEFQIIVNRQAAKAAS
jgi:hypothetical protein